MTNMYVRHCNGQTMFIIFAIKAERKYKCKVSLLVKGNIFITKSGFL